MSHNHTYNLMNQLTQEMKSLWRIEKHYIPEAQTDQERELFEDMARVKKAHIEALEQLVAQTLGGGHN
ncbi:MAG: hypothetical protein LRY41_03060 [Candidatus Pacebacteria bacterium]|nr:hypothetical protein [Candidatus Paceibacterota bacterium]MCD8528277.1 hypothetical protein [Candidatus Paceibacterota bacterium]MCD8563966.1 hypothetical protein [Candidatus Paceibacterota bacterium]